MISFTWVSLQKYDGKPILVQKSEKLFWVGGFAMGQSGYLKHKYYFAPPNGTIFKI